MRKEKNIYLITVIVISVIAGVLYNWYILPKCAQKLGNTFLTDYLTYFVCAALLSGGLVFVLARLKDALPFECFLAAAVPFLLFYWAFGEKDVLISIYNCFLTVFVIRMLINGMQNNESPLKSHIFLIFSLAITFLTGGIMQSVISFLALVGAEFYSLHLFKPENRKMWRLYIYSFAVTVFLVLWIVISKGDLYRLIAWLHPNEYEPYKTVIRTAQDLKSFNFKPENSFLPETDTLYSFTWLHFAKSAGFLPIFVLVILQSIGFLYALIGSLKIKDKTASLLQLYSALLMELYFLFTLCSSCMWISYTEIGAPIFTVPGLQIVFPAAIYIYTELTSKETIPISERFKPAKIAYIFGTEEDDEYDC